MTPNNPNQPAITSDQHGELKRIFDSGAGIKQMAEHFGVSTSSLCRALGRAGLPTVRVRDRKPTSAGQHPPKSRDEWKARITDYPDSLTAAICGDPSPMRRQLLREGRI